jgi:hypothetical protein
LTGLSVERSIARMPTAIRAWRDRVAEAVSEGASLDEVDSSLIQPAPLPPDLRDALWLYAWGLSEREEAPVHTLQRLPS